MTTYSNTVDLNSKGWYLDTNPTNLLGNWTNSGDVVTVNTTDFYGIQVLPGVTVNTLGGNDNISGTSTSTTIGSSGILNSGILNNGTINTGAGKDTITGAGDITGIYNNGTINTGDGDDTIAGTTSRFVIGASGGAIRNTGIINTGAGNDTITGIATVAYGIYNGGTINTGTGSDTITGFGGTYGIYNIAGTIDTGAGNDTITGTDMGGSAGIRNEGPNATIKTGAGNDTLTGTGFSSGGFGIENDGTIDMGKGNDIVDALTGGFGGNGTINMGDGNDIVKGFGTGYFDGGNGFDTLLLGSGAYTVSYTANSAGFYTIDKGGIDMFLKLPMSKAWGFLKNSSSNL